MMEDAVLEEVSHYRLEGILPIDRQVAFCANGQILSFIEKGRIVKQYQLSLSETRVLSTLLNSYPACCTQEEIFASYHYAHLTHQTIQESKNHLELSKGRQRAKKMMAVYNVIGKIRDKVQFFDIYISPTHADSYYLTRLKP